MEDLQKKSWTVGNAVRWGQFQTDPIELILLNVTQPVCDLSGPATLRTCDCWKSEEWNQQGHARKDKTNSYLNIYGGKWG